MLEANVILTARHTSPLAISWSAIDWKTVNRQVNNLRGRIYRASVAGNTKLASSLQKLMIRSRANKLSAIRRVTQVNQGKRSPGIDQIVIKTNRERSWLYEKLSESKEKASPIRRVYIPKGNGKVRPLGLPTILDRCKQAVVKTALEPYWEAKFEPCSYGFRPGRSAQDAIQKIFSIVRPGKSREWILKVDIEAAFDHVSHDYLLKKVGNSPARAMIKQWLQAGIMEGGQLTPTKSGTPQGGIISPLLFNIALHGMETSLGISYYRNNQQKRNTPYMLVRYADDAVVFAKSEEEMYQAKVKLKTFLQERGLNLSEEKTKTYHIREGFDFLGFNIKQYPSSSKKKGIVILTKPSKQSVKDFKKQMTLAWKGRLSWGTSRMIEELNLKLKGWASYFRSGASKKTFHNLDHWLWKKQIWYTRRRHPNKSWQWCKDKYWGKIMARDDKWVFMDKEEGDKETYLWKLNWTPIKRHVMVKARHSPDDPSLKQYWKDRQKGRNPYWSKTSGILWRRQVGKCRVCLANIDNGEKVEVHHVLPKRLGGNDHIDNLAMLHVTCHRQVHYELRKGTTDVSKLLEPYAG